MEKWGVERGPATRGNTDEMALLVVGSSAMYKSHIGWGWRIDRIRPK